MESQPIESGVFRIDYAGTELSCRSDGEVRGPRPIEVAEHEPAGEPRNGMLRLTEREYRSIVEYSPVMIWRSGLDGGCDYFNDTWLQFTGRTMDQEWGNGWATRRAPGRPRSVCRPLPPPFWSARAIRDGVPTSTS
jgi:PAS domain-containing protein